MQRRKRPLGLNIIIFLIWLILIRLGEKKASIQELTLASVLYFVCCFPFLRYFQRSEKDIPYLPIFGIFYFIYIGFPIFNSYNLILLENLNPAIVLKCLHIALWGFIFLMVSFYTPLGNIINLVTKPLKLPLDYRKAYTMGIFIGLLGIGVQYLTLTRQIDIIFSGPVNFIGDLSRLGIAILFMLQLQNRLKSSGKLFLWVGLFLPRFLLDSITGATFPILLDFALIFFLYFYFRRSIPWLRLAMAVLVFFGIFSARNEYRETIWFGSEYTNARPMEKINLYLNLIYKSLSRGKEQRKYTYEHLAARTNYLTTFVKVVELTPAQIPYWNGYTYTTLLTSFIPRFIMPWKPRKTLGQEFGHRYMFLSPKDTATSYNLPIFIEMYINFGEWFVITGMFILGLIFRALYNTFNHPNVGEGGLLISIMIFTKLLSFESDFALIFGAMFQYMILWYILVKMIKRNLPILK